MNFIPARGFVLGASAYGEADKIVQLYTLQWGRVKAIAKGIRKPKSKLASSIELFTESGFFLHRKSGSGLFVLGQAKIIKSYSDLKKDFQTITALQVLGELVAQSLPEAEPHPEIYSLVTEELGALQAHPGNQELFLTAFGVKFLDLMGFPLELNVCSECGSDLEKKKVFLIPHRGGALCESCCPAGPGRLRITAVGLEVLKKLRALPLERVHILRLKPDLLRPLFLALMEYLEHTIEKKLKTVEYYLKVLPG